MSVKNELKSWTEYANEVIEGYREKMGMAPWSPGDGTEGIVQVRESWGREHVPLTVRIRLDGYKVEFFHNEEFVIPPHGMWEKC